MLQPRPIMLLDEATSNLDSASDDAMQTLLRSAFRDLTLLTIAHRLQTVIDYDSILAADGAKCELGVVGASLYFSTAGWVTNLNSTLCMQRPIECACRPRAPNALPPRDGRC